MLKRFETKCSCGVTMFRMADEKFFDAGGNYRGNPRRCKNCSKKSNNNARGIDSAEINARHEEAMKLNDFGIKQIRPGDPGFDEIAKQCTPIGQIRNQAGRMNLDNLPDRVA